ncbi:TonB-dependent receptor [Gammaproteobacteria bacterium]|nr:TonB-dependent receptor [Gammaproteobacteria bacterium]
MTILQDIESIVGGKGLITGKDVFNRKAGIWIDDGIRADAIVRPKDTLELSKVLAICNKTKQAVIPHGGLTGLAEGAITQQGQIAISSERLTAIEEVDQWRYDFGLRYDKWEETELNLDSETNGAVHGGKVDDTETLPRVSITRSFDNGSIAYFTTSQGYEPGGLNNGVPYTDAAGNKLLGQFGKEEALQNELGWKGTMNEGRTSVSLAYFDIEYKDRAFQVVAPNPGGPGLIEYVTNIGDSDQNGLELEVTTQATDNLVLSFAAGFVNSDFADGTILADGTDLSGVTPPATIDKSFLVAADYSSTLSNGTEMTLGAQWSFTGQGVGMPVVGALKNPSYKVLNLQAAFVTGPWDFTLTLDNAMNEDYYTDMEVFPNLSNDQATIGDTFIIGTYGVQKLFQASLSYNF